MRLTYILQVAEQIGNRFSLVIGEGGLVDAIARATGDGTQASRDVAPTVDRREARQTCFGESTHAVQVGGPSDQQNGPASVEGGE